MSRSLYDLHPDFRPVVAEFLAQCERSGITVVVTCTWRSAAEQAALYAQGRTAPGHIVTHAKPGQSLHNVCIDGAAASRALDVYPVVHGKIDFTGGAPEWDVMGRIGEECGMDWAFRWPVQCREKPHFQQKGVKL